MTFQSLPLHPKILKAIEDLGHTQPTPIQSLAIPKVMEGVDLRASAQTGTGKTAAFLLPAINRLAESNPSASKAGPRVLVLVPTRELAMQVATESAKYCKHLPHVRTVCIYGGAPYPIQSRELSRPYDILVATPGRLIDHLERGRIRLGRIEMLILDEADRMLDMGFIEPVERIASGTPKERQTLMFSATMKGTVMSLSRRLLKNPMEVSVEPDQKELDNIEQRVHSVDNLEHKYRLLDHLLSDETVTQAIVFTATKHQADTLADKLHREGHLAEPLHGDMNQRQRTRTIAGLRRGEIRVLVATDVAARGIDVRTITHVFNFDLPSTEEDYVHRIGRTGRPGATGIPTSFAAYKDLQTVRRIEQFTGKKINSIVIPGFEPKFKPQAKPAGGRGKSWGPKRRFGPRRF